MKVLHVTLSLRPGGRREAILSLARGLAALGVDSHLCCIEEMGTDRQITGLAGSICLERKGLLDHVAMRRLRTYCREHGIDLLHSHDAASQFICTLAMPFFGPPLLMSFHRSLDFESARVRDRIRNALAGLRTRAIVTASQARQRHYQKRNLVADDKVVCIPLGIDTRRFAPNAEQRARHRSALGVTASGRLIGVAGHFGREKGVDIAIEVFQRMLRKHPHLDAHMVILGRGDASRTQFIHDCIDPALSPQIHLAGFQRHPEHWYAACDLFLHAARREAFGLVLVEAMGCGLPVLAAAAGGMLDIVTDGTTGRLVAPGDIDAMAEALAEMLLDEPALAAMSLAARQRVQGEYTEALTARRFHALYQRVTGDQNPSD
ncbi:MAG: glycosyltransferase family 4 protein [Rhodanobacteraceae bacterium]